MARLSDVSKDSKRLPREKVAIRLTPSGLDQVDALAYAEERTRSDMIRILLREALLARLEKEKM